MSHEVDFSTPPRLNSFGETIRRIEAERRAEAEAAIAAGWTEADHPEKCCTPAKTTPQPKRAGRPLEEIERLRDRAQDKATHWQSVANTLQGELNKLDANRPKFDHGMMQVALKTRQKGMNRESQLWEDTEHAKERANHYRRLTAKYAAQIEKRKQ